MAEVIRNALELAFEVEALAPGLSHTDRLALVREKLARRGRVK